MKHELQHARQFEMIAGLENGLEKLNFVSIYPVVQYVKKNPLALAQFKDIIKDVNMDRLGEYDNIICDNNEFKGIVNVSESGLSDIYYDLVLCEKSIERNYGKEYIDIFKSFLKL